MEAANTKQAARTLRRAHSARWSSILWSSSMRPQIVSQRTTSLDQCKSPDHVSGLTLRAVSAIGGQGVRMLIWPFHQLCQYWHFRYVL